MAVTARFKVSKITPETGGPNTAEVELTPDYAQGRNADWSKATPYGVIRLGISNPPALKEFEERGVGVESKPVHVLFEFPDE